MCNIPEKVASYICSNFKQEAANDFAIMYLKLYLEIGNLSFAETCDRILENLSEEGD